MSLLNKISYFIDYLGTVYMGAEPARLQGWPVCRAGIFLCLHEEGWLGKRAGLPFNINKRVGKQ